jgi:glycosyltransferase involved in cell wall biosynthesis
MGSKTDQCSITSPRLHPRVSVVIPTYRHQDTIISTLESVFLQTFQDFEVIVVNDGSPDATAEVLAPLAASGRIRYFEQSNKGQAAARNRGLAEATGEFIAFLDDDDLWPPDKLQWQVAYLERNPAIAAVGGGFEWTGGRTASDTTWGCEGVVTAEMVSSGNPFASPGQTLIRTQVLCEIGGFDTSLWGADDLDLWFRMSLNAKIVAIRRTALRYRSHEQNASLDVIRMYVNTFRMIRKHLRLAPEESLDVIRRNYYIWLHNYLGPTVAHCLIKGSWKPSPEKNGIKIKRNITLVLTLLTSMITAPMLGWLFVRGTMIAAIKKVLRRFERLN